MSDIDDGLDELEVQIEQQQETIEAQQRRLGERVEEIADEDR